MTQAEQGKGTGTRDYSRTQEGGETEKVSPVHRRERERERGLLFYPHLSHTASHLPFLRLSQSPPRPVRSSLHRALQLASQAGRKRVGGGKGGRGSVEGLAHKREECRSTPTDLLISRSVPSADELSTYSLTRHGWWSQSCMRMRAGCWLAHRSVASP